MSSPVDVFVSGAREGVYPGGQLAASKAGRRLASLAAGRLRRDGPETHRNVVYDLASLTKPLATSILIGRGLEAGRCELDDPLARFVPGVRTDITLRRALEHSTGFPAHRRFDADLTPGVATATWAAYRAIIQAAAATVPEAPVDTRAVYSDIGFILLGAALETMHDKPLSTLFDELKTPLCFRDQRGPPASMPRDPGVPIAPTEACAPGEVHDENCRAMGGVAGHAGLWGTAEGVLAVAESLLAAYAGARDQLLAPETVRLLWQPSTVPGSSRTLGWDRPSGGDKSSTGGRWPLHSVGHLGFTGTSLWIEPQRALAVVLITNRVCPTRANEAIRQLRPRLHDAAWTAWA